MNSSERQFGFAFAILFAAIAVFPLAHRQPIRIWAAAVSAVLLVLALTKPVLLGPLNRRWQRVTRAMNAIVTPVAMALLYFGVVTPTGFAMRLLGKDPLRLRANPRAETYWIAREPAGPPPESMTNPF